MSLPSPDPVPTDTGSARILVVEGFTPARTLLLRALRAEGYDAVSTVRAVRAIERCRSERFDLLITEVEVPGGAGADIARAAQDGNPRIGVLLMSASPEVALQVAEPDPRRGFVLKPVDIDVLVGEVRRLLGGTLS